MPTLVLTTEDFCARLRRIFSPWLVIRVAPPRIRLRRVFFPLSVTPVAPSRRILRVSMNSRPRDGVSTDQIISYVILYTVPPINMFMIERSIGRSLTNNSNRVHLTKVAGYPLVLVPARSISSRSLMFRLSLPRIPSQPNVVLFRRPVVARRYRGFLAH